MRSSPLVSCNLLSNGSIARTSTVPLAASSLAVTDRSAALLCIVCTMVTTIWTGITRGAWSWTCPYGANKMRICFSGWGEGEGQGGQRKLGDGRGKPLLYTDQANRHIQACHVFHVFFSIAMCTCTEVLTFTGDVTKVYLSRPSIGA
jgi:hypothetical protein